MLTEVTPDTTGNVPSAADIRPAACAMTLGVLPPADGDMGIGGGVTHGTSCHVVSGLTAWKHPVPGKVFNMLRRHSATCCLSGADEESALAAESDSSSGAMSELHPGRNSIAVAHRLKAVAKALFWIVV